MPTRPQPASERRHRIQVAGNGKADKTDLHGCSPLSNRRARRKGAIRAYGNRGILPTSRHRADASARSRRYGCYVGDLASHIHSLQIAGVRFRNDVEVGPGGMQLLIEEPDGNPIKVHEAPAREALKRCYI